MPALAHRPSPFIRPNRIPKWTDLGGQVRPYAWSYLAPLGKFDQAVAETKKALELDPFSRIDNTVLGMTYFYARRNDEALQQFQTAVALNRDFFVTYYDLSWLYAQVGQYPDAITKLAEDRFLAGEHRVKSAASDEVFLRKAFTEGGAQGFWQEMQRQGTKDDPEIANWMIHNCSPAWETRKRHWSS
ncbi:MAG TPA: tetratricopeptide repeat protein [Terracidiphilus sp.]|nr:tetratricopeptide repeat protein [Terracidiphilus sp.]